MDDKKKTLKIIIFSGIVLLTIGTVLFFVTRSGGESTSSDDGTNIATFIPIWVAIFPSLYAQRASKKDEEMTNKQRKLVVVFVGLTVLAIVGTLVYMLIN